MQIKSVRLLSFAATSSAQMLHFALLQQGWVTRVEFSARTGKMYIIIIYNIIHIYIYNKTCRYQARKTLYNVSHSSFLKCVCVCVCVQWVPEITHHCPKTPFLLVGTQIDLRDDPSTIEKLAKNKQKPITPETADKLGRDLKAVKYVECSALTQVSQSRSTHTLSHCTHTLTRYMAVKCWENVQLPVWCNSVPVSVLLI